MYVTHSHTMTIEFKLQCMYSLPGIKHTARVNEPIISVVAQDPDFEENGTIAYMVAASNLYKFGASQSSGSVVPSPFNITQDGEFIIHSVFFIPQLRIGLSSCSASV